MSLIDYTYFVGELNIPGTDKEDVQLRLDLFIAKYEKKFLIDLLGFQLYSDFTAGLTGVVDPKWTKLKSGTNYTYNQRTYQFNGLIQADTLQSIIANYVYCHWLKNEESQTTAVGEVMTKTDNAARVSSKYKYCRAWNEMVTEIWKVVSFLDANGADYPNWSWYVDTDGIYWQGYNHSRLKDIFYPVNTLNL